MQKFSDMEISEDSLGGTPLELLDNQQDHRTLGEVAEDEQRQWAAIWNELREHRFDTKQQAYYFYHNCMAHTYRRLGFHPKVVAAHMVKRDTDELQKLMYRFWRIRVSFHNDEDELWKVGVYIYKGQELVAFVSRPARYQSEFVLSVPFWLVRTNVELPAGKGVKI